jgi:hypothetical protein
MYELSCKLWDLYEVCLAVVYQLTALEDESWAPLSWVLTFYNYNLLVS